MLRTAAGSPTRRRVGRTRQPMAGKNIWRLCKTYGRLIGYPELRPHALRHGVAVEVLEQRHDLEEVRALLGHARIDTTQIYTRIRPPQLKRAVAFYDLSGHLKTGQSWTGQNRPVGRAPQAVRVFYRIAVGLRKSAAAGGGPAGCTRVSSLSKSPISGDTGIWGDPRSSILEALGRSPMGHDRLMPRPARPGGGCASSAGRRSRHGRGGGAGPGRRRRQRCRPTASPSLPPDDWK